MSCIQCRSQDLSKVDSRWYCKQCGSRPYKANNSTISNNTKASKFPFDYTLEIPEKYQWLFTSRNISLEIIKELGIGYSPFYDRIIIPLNKDKTIAIGRTLDANRVDKYRHFGPNRYIPFYTRLKEPMEKLKNVQQDNISLILVEDYLSAIKVSLAVKNEPYIVWANMGTNGVKKIEPWINYYKFKKVIFWFDGDKAGRNANIKFIKHFSRFYLCDSIFTNKDPKEYDYQEIKEFIRGMGVMK